MRRTRYWLYVLGLTLLVGTNLGCMSRAISEGVGVVTGASGKVVPIQPAKQLQSYKCLKIESLSVTPGLKAPVTMAGSIRENFLKVAAKKKLASSGTPCLLLSGEVTNFESADAVDTAIGPLEECIVRAQLVDSESTKVLAVANLVARAKSTTAGGEENLAEGLGKALSKWLKAGGITSAEEEKEEE